MPSPKPPRRPSLRLRVLLLGIGLLLATGTAELLLHALPGLLPTWFRERYPHHGIELRYPGIFDRTPLDAVPLPYQVDPYAGPPPHDLVDYGIAPASAASVDLTHTPHLVLPADRDGLPNTERHAQTDVVLVGDSFLVYGSQQEPPGLQRTLAEGLSTHVCNLGISGLGPLHERWMLQNVGLPQRPKLVLWFFFGGNDVLDATYYAIWQAQGTTTLGQLFAAERAPRLLLPAMLGALLGKPPTKALLPEPVAPFPSTTGSWQAWFHPDYLRLASIDAAALVQGPGWLLSTQVLQQAAAAAAAQDARFVVVYVPSKEQVHLGHVTIDAAVLARCVAASNLTVLAVPNEPAALQAAVLANRGAVEAQLRAFCAKQGIAWWSATPVLEELAARGGSGFYTTDTHWHGAGQRAVGKALIEFVRAQGLLGK